MIDALLGLPDNLRLRLEAALKAGTLRSPYSEISIRSATSGEVDSAALQRELLGLEKRGISGRAAMTCLQIAAEQRRGASRPDLVWTGPKVPGLHPRPTLGVFKDMIAAAEHSIWVSTYAYYDGQRAFADLAARMDAVADLEVTLLVNIKRKWSDTTRASDLLKAFSERFWNRDWPGARRPRLYYDPRSLEMESASGVLHAKALVVDGREVLVTSANFTEAAMEKNIELGLQLTDRTLAQYIINHFRRLIELEQLETVPVL